MNKAETWKVVLNVLSAIINAILTSVVVTSCVTKTLI